jgi:hypothetical protein
MIRIVIALLIFFSLGALFIISNGELHLAKQDEQALFFQEYRIWLSTISENARQITGAVIAGEWLPRSNQSAVEP